MSEHATSRAFSVCSRHRIAGAHRHHRESLPSLIWAPSIRWFALLIATIKATLVVLFFMHVKGASEKLTGVVVVAGFFFLAILLSLSMADYLTRACGSARKVLKLSS